MKSITTLALLAILLNGTMAEEPINLSPIPPIGAEVRRTPEGSIRIQMDQAGTLILGTAKIQSLEGSKDPANPGRYHIQFTATGKNISPAGGSEVSLVVYLNKGQFKVHSAHGGTVLLPTQRDWTKMKTRYLAKSNGSTEPEDVILAVHFKEAGSIELKDLSCKAVNLSSE